MWKLLIPLLLVVACDKTVNPKEEDSVGNPVVGDLGSGQYLTKDTADFQGGAYYNKPHFTFRLDKQCNGTMTIQESGDSVMADSAFKTATKWRAWSEVGEEDQPGGQIFYNLPIKKGPHGWEPSCEHPWGDSIGNVKSVVVWE